MIGKRCRALLTNVGLVSASTLFALLVAELALRIADYRFSPIAFLVPETIEDWRAYHMGGRDPRVSKEEPLTVFDPILLWRLNPRVSAEIGPQGYRGPEIREPMPSAAFLIVALGDSNTLGPLHTTGHWPGLLQERIARSRAARQVQVINAGVYGYTSFQGLRLFRQVLRHRPDLVYFSFGGNDAAPVKSRDVEYASSIERLAGIEWLRLAPPLAHIVQRAIGLAAGAEKRTHRVTLDEYRQNLEAFVQLARSQGVVPVLLTRPYLGHSANPDHWMSYAPEYNALTRRVAQQRNVGYIDVYEKFRNDASSFADPMHFNRRGHEALADLVFRQLRGAGIVGGDAADPRMAATGEEPRASSLSERNYVLERAPGQTLLLLDFSRTKTTTAAKGRVEVNGRTAMALGAEQGRIKRLLELGTIQEKRVEVRFLLEASPQDSGIDVHAVRLLVPHSGIYATELNLGAASDGRLELESGWWQRETWPDGRAGRWTRAEARLTLERTAGEGGLYVDFSSESPRDLTASRIEVNGQKLHVFSGGNRRQQQLLDIRAVKGRLISVRFITDHPYVPRDLVPGSQDSRTLGVFVHAVRLVTSAR